MTRKHFQEIAATIRNSAIDDTARAQIAHEMAGTLRQFNNSFDCQKFIEACTRK